jgi:putative tryptophan/tyrosine transport system substrate-binding protein
MIVSSSDPVGDGLITSFTRPGGNITGIVSVPEEVPAKRLELLQEVVPKLSRVGFLWDATGGPFHVSKAMNDASQSLRVEVLSLEVRDPADFAGVIGAAAKAPVGGLIISGTPLFGRNRKQIVELVTNHRLPAIGSWRLWPDAGLLMAYGANFAEEFRRAATYVDKILKGAKLPCSGCI